MQCTPGTGGYVIVQRMARAVKKLERERNKTINIPDPDSNSNQESLPLLIPDIASLSQFVLFFILSNVYLLQPANRYMQF
jgi:hypothetical protein